MYSTIPRGRSVPCKFQSAFGMHQKISTAGMMMIFEVLFIMLLSLCAGKTLRQDKMEILTLSQNQTILRSIRADNPSPAPTADPSTTTNSTILNDGGRGDKQYFIPYPFVRGSYSAAVADGYFNPFPRYYPAKLGGVTGPGNKASSCAFAYPNRRYSCLGLGRRK